MSESNGKSDIKIAVIGGGTGSFSVLTALKGYAKNISAIVNMVDDGGSTGVLRDELGVLPPGDVRQCLVALSDSPKLRELFNYRFEDGTFKGHPFGNIFLTALEKMSGSFSEAVKTASDVLRVNGTVIPATLDNVRLQMEWPDVSVTLNGESVVSANPFENDPREAALSLIPAAIANPEAVLAINQADLVVIAPGNLYSSLGPLLVIEGIAKALRDTSAVSVYVSNLVTVHGQTEGFTVSDHANEIERFAGGPFLDYVLYNNQTPNEDVARLYEEERAFLVQADDMTGVHYSAIPGEFLGKTASKNSTDLLPGRSLIRHDTKSLAQGIMDLYESAKNLINN